MLKIFDSYVLTGLMIKSSRKPSASMVDAKARAAGRLADLKTGPPFDDSLRQRYRNAFLAQRAGNFFHAL